MYTNLFQSKLKKDNLKTTKFRLNALVPFRERRNQRILRNLTVHRKTEKSHTVFIIGSYKKKSIPRRVNQRVEEELTPAVQPELILCTSKIFDKIYIESRHCFPIKDLIIFLTKL
jgi:hypothetical protein